MKPANPIPLEKPEKTEKPQSRNDDGLDLVEAPEKQNGNGDTLRHFRYDGDENDDESESVVVDAKLQEEVANDSASDSEGKSNFYRIEIN